MHEWKGIVMTVDEVQTLYLESPYEWFLLEVVDRNEKGRAKTIRIVNHHPDKEVLREYILEDDQAGNKKYIFFFSDPDLPCELD